MDGKKKIFQITGYQNSGKTTLVQEIIKYGDKAGLNIGSIKHHGHGGASVKENLDKDSDKHLQAGAVYAAVEGNGELIIKNQSKNWSLEDLIIIYERLPIDLILIEGYKHALLPKAVIIRNNEDLCLLKELSNIQAVLTWIPINETVAFPVFSIDQKRIFIEWLFKYLF